MEKYNFKREVKYLVIKQSDIIDALTDGEILTLDSLMNIIDTYRHNIGKKRNNYIVVNQDEPYAEEVWKLIQAEEEKRIKKIEHTEKIRRNSIETIL